MKKNIYLWFIMVFIIVLLLLNILRGGCMPQETRNINNDILHAGRASTATTTTTIITTTTSMDDIIGNRASYDATTTIIDSSDDGGSDPTATASITTTIACIFNDIMDEIEILIFEKLIDYYYDFYDCYYDYYYCYDTTDVSYYYLCYLAQSGAYNEYGIDEIWFVLLEGIVAAIIAIHMALAVLAVINIIYLICNSDGSGDRRTVAASSHTDSSPHSHGSPHSHHTPPASTTVDSRHTQPPISTKTTLIAAAQQAPTDEPSDVPTARPTHVSTASLTYVPINMPTNKPRYKPTKGDKPDPTDTPPPTPPPTPLPTNIFYCFIVLICLLLSLVCDETDDGMFMMNTINKVAQHEPIITAVFGGSSPVTNTLFWALATLDLPVTNGSGGRINQIQHYPHPYLSIALCVWLLIPIFCNWKNSWKHQAIGIYLICILFTYSIGVSEVLVSAVLVLYIIISQYKETSNMGGSKHKSKHQQRPYHNQHQQKQQHNQHKQKQHGNQQQSSQQGAEIKQLLKKVETTDAPTQQQATQQTQQAPALVFEVTQGEPALAKSCDNAEKIDITQDEQLQQWIADQKLCGAGRNSVEVQYRDALIQKRKYYLLKQHQSDENEKEIEALLQPLSPVPESALTRQEHIIDAAYNKITDADYKEAVKHLQFICGPTKEAQAKGLYLAKETREAAVAYEKANKQLMICGKHLTPLKEFSETSGYPFNVIFNHLSILKMGADFASELVEAWRSFNGTEEDQLAYLKKLEDKRKANKQRQRKHSETTKQNKLTIKKLTARRPIFKQIIDKVGKEMEELTLKLNEVCKDEKTKEELANKAENINILLEKVDSDIDGIIGESDEPTKAASSTKGGKTEDNNEVNGKTTDKLVNDIKAEKIISFLKDASKYIGDLSDESLTAVHNEVEIFAEKVQSLLQGEAQSDDDI